MSVTEAGVGLESFGYHEKSETYRAEFDRAKTAPSSAVVASLGEVLDVDVREMDPLYESIDPDALDALMRQRSDPEGDVAVCFTVDRHEVSVYDYGVVAISPGRSSGSDPAADRDSPA